LRQKTECGSASMSIGRRRTKGSRVVPGLDAVVDGRDRAAVVEGDGAGGRSAGWFVQRPVPARGAGLLGRGLGQRHVRPDRASRGRRSLRRLRQLAAARLHDLSVPDAERAARSGRRGMVREVDPAEPSRTSLRTSTPAKTTSAWPPSRSRPSSGSCTTRSTLRISCCRWWSGNRLPGTIKPTSSIWRVPPVPPSPFRCCRPGRPTSWRPRGRRW